MVHDSAVMMSLPPQSVAYTVIRNFPAGTDLEQEARDAACPVKKFFAETRKAIADWFYQTMPIGNTKSCSPVPDALASGPKGCSFLCVFRLHEHS